MDTELKKLLRIPIPIARFGLNRDIEPTELIGQYSPFMQNMVVETERLRKRLGYTTVGGNLPLSGVGSELIQYVDAGGDIHQIALTTTNAYKHNVSSDLWELITPCVEIEDCEDVWVAGSGDTIAVDSLEKVKGTKSVSIELVANRSDGDKLAYEDFDSIDIRAQNKEEPEELTLTHIGFWIKSSAALDAGDLELVVSEAANGAKTGTYSESLTIALTADTWTFVQVAETLTDFELVVSVALYANATLASGLILHIDDVRAYAPFTGEVDDRWSHSRANDLTYFSNNGGDALLISNGVKDIYFYEGQSEDVFQKLDVSDFAAFASTKEIIESWNHFFALNYNNNVQNVRSIAFADLGDIVDWTGGTSDVRALTDSVGKILRAKKLGMDVIIYSGKTITSGMYVGAPILFTFPTLITDLGLFSPKALWDFANVHYFLGSDLKVHEYRGGRQLTLVGKAIEESLFEELDNSKRDRIVAGFDYGRYKLYFFIPAPGEDYAKVYYAMNQRLANKPWEYGKFAHDVRDFSVFSNYRDWYCDDDDKKDLWCDEVAFYCDGSYTQSGYEMAVFISSAGYIYKLDEALGSDAGESIEAIYDTGDIVLEDEYLNGNWLEFSFTSKSIKPNGDAIVKYSTDSGFTWITLTEYIVDGSPSGTPISLSEDWETYFVPVDVFSRKIRFRIYQNSIQDLQLRDDMHVTVDVETEKE